MRVYPLHFGQWDNVLPNPLSGNYRVTFLTGPAQKSSKYGTGPTQQQKMTKYTGPTQDTEDDWVFNKQFLSLKKIPVSSAESRSLSVTEVCAMPRREWSVPQRQFLVEKKLQGICVAQIQAEYAQR